MKRFAHIMAGFALLAAAGCSSMRENSVAPLKIGVTPDYQPLVFMQDGHVTGAEVDFGQQLGKFLNRPVEFVSVPWENQIEALTAGRTDIIMSGMTQTKARGLKIAFSDSYLDSGLRGICRRADIGQFDSPEKIKNTGATIGVMPGTTADIFVQKYCPAARRIAVGMRKDGIFNLLSRDIDLYIDDGFAIADLYAANESNLGPLPMPLTIEQFAWGLRPGDTELIGQVNAALAQWKQDGTYDSIVRHWMPYLDRLKK